MARKVTPSQLKRMMRQAEQRARSQQKQVIDKLNREIRQHNQKVQQSVNKYNAEVRAYNARVRSNQQRLRTELARLKNQTTPTTYVHFRESVDVVQRAYTVVDNRSDRGEYDARYNEYLDLAEREAANSASVMNALVGGLTDPIANDPSADPELFDFLSSVSGELLDRWRGALFSLHPQNPDAARHFCTSAREIFTAILELRAPDAIVLGWNPQCQVTNQGKPTRRAKIQFFLHRKDLKDESFEEFVEQDMQNVIDLFGVFNSGTHGSAGTMQLGQLQALKLRVEDGLSFLRRIVD